jgi:hypothetical protein
MLGRLDGLLGPLLAGWDWVHERRLREVLVRARADARQDALNRKPPGPPLPIVGCLPRDWRNLENRCVNCHFDGDR